MGRHLLSPCHAMRSHAKEREQGWGRERWPLPFRHGNLEVTVRCSWRNALEPLEEMWERSPGEKPQQECNSGAISMKAMAEVKELKELSGEGKWLNSCTRECCSLRLPRRCRSLQRASRWTTGPVRYQWDHKTMPRSGWLNMSKNKNTPKQKLKQRRKH